MTRFTRIAALLTVLLVMMAFAIPASGRRGESHEVPLKGTVVGEHDRDLDSEDCVGFLWEFFGNGTGRLSHLGKVDFDLTHCTAPGDETAEPPEPPFKWEMGTITFTAPNGDTLIVKETGGSLLVFGDTPGPPIGFTYDGTWMADGGTGRFANATGSGTFDGFGTIPPEESDALAVIEIEFDGMIAYNASDRSD